jgi:hypothetical protein
LLAFTVEFVKLFHHVSGHCAVVETVETNVHPPQSVVMSQYTLKPVQLSSGSIVYVQSIFLHAFLCAEQDV